MNLEDLKKGLTELGLSGHIKVEDLGLSRYKVLLTCVYFGIWDAIKKTFAD